MTCSSEVERVSVVVTHYNRPELLGRAIESVLQEDKLVGEVLVVDDCSSDANFQLARSVLEKFSSKVRICRHPQNMGANSARNTGIELAKFPYVAFLDGDDEWLPGKLSTHLDYMRQTGLDFSATQFAEVSEARTRVLPRRSLGRLDIGSYIFLFGGHFSTSTLLIKNSVAKLVQFKVGLRKFQDWEYAIRLQSSGYRGDVLMKPLTIYHTVHDNRISSHIRIDLAKEFFEGVKALIPAEAALAFNLRALPRMHVKLGRPFDGVAVAVRALFAHPKGILPLVAHAFSYVCRVRWLKVGPQTSR